jgi:hypothetical protein
MNKRYETDKHTDMLVTASSWYARGFLGDPQFVLDKYERRSECRK